MKYELKCKLCKIGFCDPKLLNKVHDLRFKENYGLRMIASTVNEIIQTSQQPDIQKLEKISYVAVQNHFSKHTGKVGKAKYKTQNIINATVTTKQELSNAELMPDEIKVSLKKYEKDRVNLIGDLTNLYELIKERFETFDEEQNFKIKLSSGADKGNLDGYSVLTRELRSCLSELNKVKQAEQLTKNVIQFALKHHTKVIIEETMKELEGIKRMLIPHVKNVDAIENIINVAQHNFGMNILKGANDTLEKTKHQFNLE